MKKSPSTKDTISDFFMNATETQKKAVFMKAARKATADQRVIMKKAGMKIKPTR